MEMEIQEHYRYEPLTEKGAIRLILLQPSRDHTAPLHCSLVHTTLQTCENDLFDSYTALSYVWGDASQKGLIMVDGMHLIITASLDTALRHIRDSLRSIRIWADGICINQEDLVEKNRQVAQMGTVYETAHHTIIFLGLGTQNSDLLLKHIASNEPLFNLDFSKDKMFMDIFTRTWFERVWVLQELVLSRDPWIQCGTIRIKWDRLHKISMESKALGLEGQKDLASCQGMHTIREDYKSNVSHHWDESPGYALLKVLKARRGLGATDSRDLIYAHLGLTGSETRETFKVDYGKSFCDLYTEVARQLLIWLPSLDIGSLAQSLDHLSTMKGLPSWVPDWSVRQNLPHEEFSFRLAPHWPESRKSSVSDYGILHENSALLTLRNVRRGTVASTMPPIPPSTSRITLPGTNDIWELYDDGKHHEVMLDIFKRMLTQTMSSEDVSNVMQVGAPSYSGANLQNIATVLQNGSLRGHTQTLPGTADPAVINDTLLMLLLIARMYLSGSTIAIMTSGAAMVVPSYIKEDDMYSFHLREDHEKKQELSWSQRMQPHKRLSSLHRHSYISTFLRRDHDVKVTDSDITAINGLIGPKTHVFGYTVSSSLPAVFRILGTGQYPYTLTISELQKPSSVFNYTNNKEHQHKEHQHMFLIS